MPASAPARILEWDSEFFGVTIGRLRSERLDRASLDLAVEWCGQHEVDCLYALLTAEDAHTVRLAEEAGARFTDMRVTMRAPAGQEPESPVADAPMPAPALRPSEPEDVPALETIARAAHAHSRFYFDTSFPDERCDALYERWIRESCAGFADEVIVAELDGRAVGYVTMHLDPSAAARIGLLGVAEDTRGRGIGAALADRAVAWARERGVSSVTVATQARNVSALRLYAQRGFLVESVALWYHLWFSVEPRGRAGRAPGPGGPDGRTG